MKKKRKPRLIRVPITRGLVDAIGQELHFGILGLQSGDNSPDNWKKVGRVIFIVSMTSDGVKKINERDKVHVDNAVITLEQISNREVATGVWSATEIEIDSLCRGALAAESILPRLDSRELAYGYGMFMALAGKI